MKVEFFRHNLTDEDIKNVQGVLSSLFLTTGALVDSFEEGFSSYYGYGSAVGLTSCTGALHLALEALGIGRGDEVITTPFTFVATANAIIQAGATPRFVDVETATGNIDAGLIEQAINTKTKAILPVHLYGQMCDMAKISAIAAKHHLAVIEDAAHAIEAERDGLRPAMLSDAACFSFYTTKSITSGEGGALLTRDAHLAGKVKMMRHHGIDRSAVQRHGRRYQHPNMPLFGWKYNMDNIQAALLIGQLRRIDEYWKKRSEARGLYHRELTRTPGLNLLPTLPGCKHACHLMPVFIQGERRDQLLWELQQRGVGIGVHYRPIHLLQYYRDRYGYQPGMFPVAEKLGREELSLPLYPKIRKDEVCYVARSLREALIPERQPQM